MNRIRLGAALLAIVVAGVAVPGAAGSARPFLATSTEEFCAQNETCGPALTTFGPATVRTLIIVFFPLPSGCFHDAHNSTFSVGASKLTVAIVGVLCPVSGQNFRFAGAFRVTGGTGRFAGVRGTGLARASRNDGPIHAVLSGTLVTP
jgi:hypothetical protein